METAKELEKPRALIQPSATLCFAYSATGIHSFSAAVFFMVGTLAMRLALVLRPNVVNVLPMHQELLARTGGDMDIEFPG